MGSNKIFKDPILIGLLSYAVIVTIMLIISLFGCSDNSRRVDLKEIYDVFEGINKFENHMNFDIDVKGCNIKGEYKGDHFREVVAVGDHELCDRFNYKLGKDPDEYTDKIVKRDIIDKINRLQNKKNCNEMIGENACNRIPKCGWVNGDCLNKKDIRLSLN